MTSDITVKGLKEENRGYYRAFCDEKIHFVHDSSGGYHIVSQTCDGLSCVKWTSLSPEEYLNRLPLEYLIQIKLMIATPTDQLAVYERNGQTEVGAVTALTPEQFETAKFLETGESAEFLTAWGKMVRVVNLPHRGIPNAEQFDIEDLEKAAVVAGITTEKAWELCYKFKVPYLVGDVVKWAKTVMQLLLAEQPFPQEDYVELLAFEKPANPRYNYPSFPYDRMVASEDFRNLVGEILQETVESDPRFVPAD